MLRANSIKAKLASQDCVFGTFCGISSPTVMEILGLAGFDFAVIDREHGTFTLGETENLIRAAASTSISPMVRVGGADPTSVRQPLDMGAAGIHVPQIESAAMAADVVRAALFHPRGERGLQPWVRNASYGVQPLAEYLADKNEDTCLVLHLEGHLALKELDAILSVDGYDVLFIGPYDLSHSLGIPGEVNHPKVRETMHRIVEETRRAGKYAGTFCATPEAALEWRAAGVNYLAVGMDANLLLTAARSLVTVLRG
jgi:4-hydroxy-2-oxoheptanedioate aldolase